jgi:Protein of unknown function (DUF4031)
MLFVDELRVYAKKQWCHLFSDCSTDELHEFANSLGLKKCWFQNKKNKSFPHYDLVSSKRRLAIQLGAKEISLKEFLKERMTNGSNP